MSRNYAALPHEYLDEMAVLTDEEFGRLVRALLRYSAAGEEPELTGNERFYARRVMMQEDRYQASYNDLTAKRSEAGRKAAQARWSREPDAAACERMQGNAKYGNTKTETKTKTKTEIKQNNTTVPRSTERRNRAAPAAQTERMRRDMVEMAKFTEGGGAR